MSQDIRGGTRASGGGGEVLAAGNEGERRWKQGGEFYIPKPEPHLPGSLDEDQNGKWHQFWISEPAVADA